MKQPPTIQPASTPGPDFDPMDRIVQDLENIQSFLSRLEMDPKDTSYLDAHLSGILGLRRTVSHQLDMLQSEPYNYSPSRLKTLHQENEKIFLYVEGAVGAMQSKDGPEFKKFIKAAGEILSHFDKNLTP